MIESNETEKDILAMAVKEFGKENQILQAVEEMAELTHALMRHVRGDVHVENVVEEIADVQIMIRQMVMIFGEAEIAQMTHGKMRRLSYRLAVKRAKKNNEQQ